MRKCKKLLIVLLCWSLIFSGLPSKTVHAANSLNLAVLETRCNELNSYLDFTLKSDSGMLYNLKFLTELMLYVDFIMEYDSYLGLTDAELQYFKQMVQSAILGFNKAYDSYYSAYFSTSFTTLAPNLEDTVFQNRIRYKVVGWTPSLLKKMLKSVDDKVTASQDEPERIQVKKQHAVILAYIAALSENTLNAYEQLNSLVPAGASPASYTGMYTTNAGQTIALKSQYIGIAQKYPDLMDYGTAANKGDDTLGIINIDLTENLAENFADILITGTTVAIPENPKLSLAYKACLAAGSTYTPFSSTVGDNTFYAALASLTKDSMVAEELVTLHLRSSAYKKPLYKRDVDSKGNPVGLATLVTLQDLISDINSGKSGALCTVMGEFQFDNQYQSWIYDVEDYNINIESVTGSTPGQDAPRDDTSGSDNSTNDNDNIVKLFGIEKVYASDASEAPDANVSDSTEASTTSEKAQKIFSSSSITNTAYFSDTILFYSSEYLRGIDNTTAMILRNIFDDTTNLQSLGNLSQVYLFVNVFGDIVTAEDLVILPGCANPILYSTGQTYNPYSVAFMNSYPSAYRNTSFFKLSNRIDVNKYLFLCNNLNIELAETSCGLITSEDSLEINNVLQGVRLQNEFYMSDGTILTPLTASRYVFGKASEWGADNPYYNYYVINCNSDITVNGEYVFPYAKHSDTSAIIAKTIAANFYRYLAGDSQLRIQGALLSDNYWLHNVILSGFDGTDNAEGFESSIIHSVEGYLSNSYSRIADNIVEFSRDLLAHLSGVIGVLGLPDMYTESPAGAILYFIQENWLVALFIASVFFLFSFSKMKYDLLQTITLGVVSLATAAMFVVVLPSYLPFFFNVIADNVNEKLTYEIVATKLESEFDGSAIDVHIDELGNVSLGTSSMTLYKESVISSMDLADSVNATAKELTIGDKIWLNKRAGVYAEGNAIKVDTGILFSNLQIAGKSAPIGEETAYQLKAVKTVSDNLDYYTVYYQIVDSFIDKLNTFSAVYALPKQTTTFANGAIKDNFIISSYVNSRLFTTPGEYAYQVPVDGTLSDEELQAYREESDAMVTLLTEKFGSNADFLGISDFLYNFKDEYKGALWAATLQNNGYYDLEWNVNEEKMNELITYVNYQTKFFIYQMEDLVGNISDEVMIKLISARALLAFNQKVSEYSSMLHPIRFNYEELTLNDVLACIFVNDYSKYVATDLDVVSYVEEQSGWFMLIVFDIALALLFLLINGMRFALSILYLLLGLMLLYAVLRQTDVKSPVIGFIKTFVIFTLCYSGLILAYRGIQVIESTTLALFVLLVVSLVLMYIFTLVLLSIFKNITTLGRVSIDGITTTRSEDKKHRVTNLFATRIDSRVTSPGRRRDTKSVDPRVRQQSVFGQYRNSFGSDELYFQDNDPYYNAHRNMERNDMIDL